VDTSLPAELRAVVGRLRAGTPEERVKAAGELAELGDKAQPAARALCEAALDPSQKVSRASLQALEKVRSDLHRPVLVLLVDDNGDNHGQALQKLSALGESGAPAVPVVLREIKYCQQLLLERETRANPPTLVALILLCMEVLPKIAPDDPQVVKRLVDLTKFSSDKQFQIVRGSRSSVTRTPFRENGVRLLGELGEGRPEHRKLIVPTLAGVLREAVQETKTQNERELLEALAAVEGATTALVKCGPEVGEILAKEAVPQLKELQFHRSDRVRQAAETLRKRIEEGP
jgi:hypothetical protein